MTDFRARCTRGPSPEGSVVYYESIPRGHARVDYDSKRWVYRVARGETRAFKAWLALVFEPNDGRAIVRGSYPEYWIQTKR